MLPEIKDITRRRKILGLTQNKLAKQANVSQSLIAKIETGRVDPSYSKMMKILIALDEEEGKKQTVTRARDICNRSVTSVNRFDPVLKASQLMRGKGFSQLPVCDGDSFVGSVTESMILDEISEKKDYSSLSRMNVGKLMDSPFPMVDENTPVEPVKSLLKHCQAVLVVRENRVVGIITKADLLSLI